MISIVYPGHTLWTCRNLLPNLSSFVTFISSVITWKSRFGLRHLYRKVPFTLKNFICLLPSLPESIRRIQRILHELHISHLTITVHPTPNRERARARLPQCTRPVRELPKHSHVLAFPEQRLDLKCFIGPYLVHGGESVNDGLRSFCNGETDALAHAWYDRIGSGEP